MREPHFVPINHSIEKIGKHFKHSKKRYSWNFTLFGTEVLIEFYTSKFTGRRRIFVNGELAEGAKTGWHAAGKSFPFRVHSENLFIYEQLPAVFDLRWGQYSFENLYLKRIDALKMAEAPQLEESKIPAPEDPTDQFQTMQVIVPSSPASRTLFPRSPFSNS